MSVLMSVLVSDTYVSGFYSLVTSKPTVIAFAVVFHGRILA